MLPSTAEALNAVLDAPNSYTYRQHNITNKLTPGFMKNIEVKEDAFLMITASVPIEVKANSLNYFRERQYNVKQNRVNVNPGSTCRITTTQGHGTSGRTTAARNRE